jgi:hypothetical protein
MMTIFWHGLIYNSLILFEGHLRPSRELLEYYRKKIAEYDEEHEGLVSKLEEYKVTYEEQVYNPSSKL